MLPPDKISEGSFFLFRDFFNRNVVHPECPFGVVKPYIQVGTGRTCNFGRGLVEKTQ
jgi:hypothetical protein